MKRGKRYDASAALIDRARFYTPQEAIGVVKQYPESKFDETVEVAIKLGVDPRKADQIVRGTLTLPHGTGKSVRVAVFAQGDKAREATEAGADVVGAQDLVERVLKGEIEFDVSVATPDMMPEVGKAGRVLGPRGLMPNPKSGTVTMDIAKAVEEIKGGKLEYRTDRQGNLHLVIGKRSFDEQKLVDNYQSVIEEVLRAKPAAAKGRYLKSVTLSTTMGPGIPIDPARARGFAEATA
ncbi:MAG: 50S ribosomal protein L1 [Actinobacteria bacterium]|nr:50S ribosomal protein L1 [Actinomycetota bacterium]